MARSPSHRMHFYMATAQVTYVREKSEAKQRHLNIVMQAETKNIGTGALNQARLILIQRLYQEANIRVEDVKDFVFLGFSYLGHMSDKEFLAEDPKDKIPQQEAMPRNVYDA